jgi:hypothetical protein
MLTSIAALARVAARGSRREGARTLEACDLHLLAAERWLCRAQDACAGGGVSYGYTLGRGWRDPYPETSGYIAPTFFRLAALRDPSYRLRARRIVDWLVRIQNADGSYANPRFGREGIVFDTGQVLFGLVSGWRCDRDPALLAAARRAAQWLCDSADGRLRWTRREHLQTPHVYNTRTAWALLEMDAEEPDGHRVAVARANLEWAVDEQRRSGIFDHCAFRAGSPPFTHTIAYASEGLLEAGLLLEEPRYVQAARRAADAALEHLRADGFLPSRIDVAGRARSATCCLTGNCQFAAIWGRLDELDPNQRYRGAACRALDYVLATQDLDSPYQGVRGGIAGSRPIWGRYAPLSYPNWAAKFFVDAMWMRRTWAR